MTKMQQIVSLYEAGTKSSKEIAEKLSATGVKVSPAYVASIVSRHRNSGTKSKTEKAVKVVRPRKAVPRDKSTLGSDLQAASVFYKSCNCDIKKAKEALNLFEMLV